MKILFCLSNGNCQYILETSSKLINNKKIKISYFVSEKLSINNDRSLINFSKKNNIKIFRFKNNNNDLNNIDYKYLEYVDKNFNLNLWKSISIDRDYGRAYIQDLDGLKSRFISKKQIIISAIEKIKYIEKMLSNLKPNVFFWPAVVASIEAPIFDNICKKKKIKFLTPVSFRIKNYFYFAKDIYNSYPNLDLYFRKTQIPKNKRKLIDKFYKDIQSPGRLSSDSEYVSKALKKLNFNFFNSLNVLLIFSFKHIIAFILFKLNLKIRKLSFHKRYELIAPIIEKFDLLKSHHLLKKYKYNNLNCDYVYYPLHRTPESSTQLNGNTYMDQLFLIQSLSKNIPINCKLLIKEHPSMIEAHSRGVNFYKEISSLPNVEIVDYRIPGSEIVKRAKLVVILDGSSAIEAIIKGVPVLTMANFIYSFLGLSIENINLSNLNNDIVKAINLKKIRTKIREKKLKKLIYLILNKGFDLREPDTFYYMIQQTSKKSIKITGEDLYNALISELKLK